MDRIVSALQADAKHNVRQLTQTFPRAPTSAAALRRLSPAGSQGRWSSIWQQGGLFCAPSESDHQKAWPRASRAHCDCQADTNKRSNFCNGKPLIAKVTRHTAKTLLMPVHRSSRPYFERLVMELRNEGFTARISLPACLPDSSLHRTRQGQP